MKITYNDHYVILSGDDNIISFINTNDKMVEFTVACETTGIPFLDLDRPGDYVLACGKSQTLTYIDIKG